MKHLLENNVLMRVFKNDKTKKKIAVVEYDQFKKITSAVIQSTTAFTDSYGHEYLSVVSVAEVSE